MVSSSKILTCLALIVAAACSAVSWAQEVNTSNPTWAQLPMKSGWLGGDAAYSVDLKDGRILWLFGDSFVKNGARVHSAASRKNAQFIHNSIGISTKSIQDMEYYWGSGVYGEDSFFQVPGNSGHTFFWPRDAAILKGKLYVFLLEVQIDGPQNSLDFKMPGVWVGRIENYERSIKYWQIEYFKIDLPPSLLIGSGVFANESDSAIYAMTNVQCKDAEAQRFCKANEATAMTRPMALARLQLSKGQMKLDFLNKNNKYSRYKSIDDLKMIVDHGNEEMSVSFVPELNSFIMIYNDNMATPNMKPGILYRKAPAIEGPWSESKTLVEFENPYIGNRDFQNSAMPYASKGHFWIGGGKLIVTFVYNFVVNGELIYSFDQAYVPFYKELSVEGM